MRFADDLQPTDSTIGPVVQLYSSTVMSQTVRLYGQTVRRLRIRRPSGCTVKEVKLAALGGRLETSDLRLQTSDFIRTVRGPYFDLFFWIWTAMEVETDVTLWHTINRKSVCLYNTTMFVHKRSFKNALVDR